MACLDNKGYQPAECIRATAQRNISVARMAAMTLIAIDNAKRAVANFREQYKIAKRGMVIAKEQQAHLEETYFPRELDFLDEFGNPQNHRDGVEAIESVEVLGRRYAGRLIAAISKRFAEQMHTMKCDMTRYNSSANRKALQDMMMTKSQAIAAARMLARNVAFAEVKAREDVDWNRRMQAVALGKGLISQAEALYRSAAGNLAGAGAGALQGLNSALGEIGNSFGQFRQAQNTISGVGMLYVPNGGGDPNRIAPGVTEATPATLAASTPFSFGVNAKSNDFALSVPFGGTTIGTANMFTQKQSDPFGLQSGSGMFYNYQEGSQTPQYQKGSMNEEQGNAGMVGHNDLVRGGSVKYPVINNMVTMNMSDFYLTSARGYTETSPKPTGPMAPSGKYLPT